MTAPSPAEKMTARARFVVAVRKIETGCPCDCHRLPERAHFPGVACPWPLHAAVREAVIEFANMEARWRADDVTCTLASCRAALLRECGMEPELK